VCSFYDVRYILHALRIIPTNFIDIFLCFDVHSCKISLNVNVILHAYTCLAQTRTHLADRSFRCGSPST